MKIFTAGYEGLTIQTFITRLQQANIDKVIDVREYPVSRKPGFVKKSYTGCLESAGVALPTTRLLETNPRSLKNGLGLIQPMHGTSVHTSASKVKPCPS